jgi:hypothetical protein
MFFACMANADVTSTNNLMRKLSGLLGIRASNLAFTTGNTTSLQSTSFAKKKRRTGNRSGRAPEALQPMGGPSNAVCRMKQYLLKQTEALARQIVVPVVVKEAREGVKDKQPRLHPQLVEVALAETVVDFGGDKAPVVQTAIQSMKELKHLRME